jgi:plastocyanin
VASDGTIWISFYAGGSLDVATGRTGSWTVEKVAVNAGPATASGTLSAIRVDSSGRPVVAFASQGTTVVAERSGSSWTSRAVPGNGGLGVSLALDKDGNPHVAYYDASGEVHHAHSIGGAPWEVTDLGTVELPSATPPSAAPTPSSSASASPSPSASPQATVQTPPQARWSTGIALDDQGVHHITWADTGNDRIVLASNQGGKFESQPIQGSDGGSTPSIAVSGDGRTLAVAWFDSTNTNLDVAVSPSAGLTLAHPLPTLQQPSVTAPASPTGTALACQPNGTTLQIKAQNVAFDTSCLAAPAGQAFTIDFDNQDATPHNVDIYDQQGGTHIGGAGPTDFFTGPGTTTYQVDALEAGTYFFQCDVHPTAMFGTFVVAKP